MPNQVVEINGDEVVECQSPEPKSACCRPWDPSIPGWAVRLGFSVILAWVCVGGMFVTTAPAFLESTGAHLDPPSGSRAVVAAEELIHLFPNSSLMGEPCMYILVRSPVDLTSNSDAKDYSEWVVETMRDSIWGEFHLFAFEGYYLPTPIEGAQLDWTLSPNKDAMIISIFTSTNGTDVPLFIDWMVSEIAVSSNIGKGSGIDYSVEIGGDWVLSGELEGKAQQSLQRMEMVVLPFAFVILAYFLRRVQLLIIPLCCICLSLGASFSFALPIARKWKVVSNDTPEVMVSTSVALSIDYSLFLLTRFLEGGKMGMTQWESIIDMVRHTGHTISVSGLLIALAFVSSLLMPIATIRSAGALTAITAMTTVLTNLTLTPAFLVCFGKVLMANPLRCFSRCFRRGDGYEQIPGADEPEPQVIDVEDPELYRKTVWYKLANFTRRHATLVIIAVLVLGAPIIAQLPNLRISVDRNLTRTRDAQSLQVLRDVEATHINVGHLMPAGIFTKALSGEAKAGDFMTEEQFDLHSELMESVYGTFDNSSGYVTRDTLLGPTHADGLRIPYSLAQVMMNPAVTDKKAEQYRAAMSQLVTYNGTAALTIVYTPFRPFGPQGSDWIKAVRGLLDNFNKKHAGQYKAYVAAQNAPDLDAADIVESHIPFIIGVICIAVMVIVGLVFRSVLLPLRLAFALGYTIAVTLGVSVVVYQTKTFWWMFPYLKDFEGEGLAYAVPAVVIPVCIALGLDYDIFLLTRVMEYRQAGMADDEAVVMGVARTGSTISGAGLIMSIAFGGLLMSSEVQLNQFGCLLTVSVLLDTFVIRTIFVPALMLKASKYNWWPRYMPPVVEAPNVHPPQQDDFLQVTAGDILLL